jgi:Hydrazine synthase alpha subunit middle domain
MKRLRTIRVIILIFCGGIALGAPTATWTEPQSAGTNSHPVIIFVEAPVIASGQSADQFPQGSHLARTTPGAPSDSAANLTPEFFAAADPWVSFDASRVVFAGRNTRGARWQIWEMNADGTGKRQITHCPANCLQPAYLPRNQIVFTMVAGKGTQQTSGVYVSQENGAGAHPITFGPGNFQVETVLRSGRILVSAGSSLTAGPQGSNSRMFYIMRTDGSGLTPFRWNSAPNVVRTGAEELDDGTVLFVEKQDPAGRMTGGELAWVRPGALHNSVITPAGSVYWSAHVLDGNRLVVAKAISGPAGALGKFGLYVFNIETRKVEQTIFRSPKFSGVEAVPLEKHTVPLYYWSILHPTRDYGRIICLNSYLSADARRGRLAGRIAHVRVITLQPDHHTERVLGEAPVESDGSFYIKVPADRPIRFQLLSTKGEVIHQQKSWIWARTGEDVPCLGCHESRALVPGDHWPLALKRPDAPIPVGLPMKSQSARH